MIDHAAAEDNMNVQLKDITVTARDGRVSHLDQVYIRGSHIRFFIVPDMLRCATRKFGEIEELTSRSGTPRCLRREAREVVVLEWREAGRPSTGRVVNVDHHAESSETCSSRKTMTGQIRRRRMCKMDIRTNYESSTASGVLANTL